MIIDTQFWRKFQQRGMKISNDNQTTGCNEDQNTLQLSEVFKYGSRFAAKNHCVVTYRELKILPLCISIIPMNH